MQLKHLAERASHRYNLIVKARQFGFTTLYCIDYLDEALWVSGMSCGIIAHERDALIKIFRIVTRAYDNLPGWMKPKTNAANANELIFDTRFDGFKLDSGIYVSMKVRSGTVQKLHITESAYIKNRAELNAGSKQAVPISGSISEESTGNGLNEFYDAVMEALQKKTFDPMDYKAYFYPWYINAEYTLPGTLENPTHKEIELKLRYNVTDGQLLWRRWKMKQLKQDNIEAGLSGEQLFNQEYPTTILDAFQSGSGNIFDINKLTSIEPEKPKTLEELLQQIEVMFSNPNDSIIKLQYINQVKELLTHEVSIWRLPVPGKEYVIGCDPSDGEGADSGDVDVWTQDDEGNKEQVAQFYGKKRPDELAELIKMMAEFYNRAFVGVESNMLSTVLFLVKIYDNYYSKIDIDEKTQKRSKKLGWYTTMKTRDVMIDDFIIHFDEDALKIRSVVTLREMRTFVKKESGKREHADGRNDDALFGGFIAVQMFKYNKPRVRVFSGKPAGF